MNSIVKFFHQLMNPHCQHCIDAEELIREEKVYCPTCDVLKMELAKAHQRIEKLTDKLTESEETIKVPERTQQVIQTRNVPWHVRRQRLETQSRLRAEELRREQTVMADAPKPDIEKLENDLGIGDAGNKEATK